MDARFLCVPGLILAGPVAALAHGVTLAYTTAAAVVVTVDARFDSGEPMAGGQVMVYAPNDPARPWLTGVCDETGQFQFTPDSTLPGTWEVQVRLAGHGDIVYVPVGNPASTNLAAGTAAQVTQASGSYTPLQLVVMGASVIWGFIGTALFFSGRRG